MVAKAIFFILLIFTSLHLYSDDLQIEKNDSALVNELKILLDKVQNTNLDKAIALCNNYLDKANEINSLYLKAYTLYYLGGVYDMKGEFDKATNCYFDALSIFEKIKDKKGIGGCFNCIGVILWEQSEQVNDNGKQEKLHKSFEYLDKALNYYQDINFDKGIGVVLMNKGIVLNDSGTFAVNHENTNQYYAQAIDYYKKAIDIFAKTGENSRIADCNFNIALLKYDIFRKNRNSTLTIDNINEIESYLLKALDGFREIDDLYGQSMVLKNMASIRVTGKVNLNEAIDYAKKSLKYAEELNASFLKYDAYYELYKAYKLSGKFDSSLFYHELYTQTKDSVFEAKSFKTIEEIEKRYDLKEKERRIELQKKENRQQRLIIISISVFLGLILILIFILFRFYKLKTQINKELNLKNTELNRLNSVQNKLISIISHDLKAPISAFFSITNTLRTNIGNLNSDQVRYYINRMYNSSLGLKLQFDNILHWALSQANGIKAEKSHINLSVTVEKILIIIGEFATEKGVETINNVDENIEINTDPKLLNIVLNNLITNAIKFTEKGGKVEVSAVKNPKKVTIAIKDTGVGISNRDLENLFTGEGEKTRNENRGTGLGLVVSREIVEILGGKIRVESKLNKGTTFYIDLYE